MRLIYKSKVFLHVLLQRRQRRVHPNTVLESGPTLLLHLRPTLRVLRTKLSLSSILIAVKPDEATGDVLSERLPDLAIHDGGVPVCDGCGRDEDGGTRRELNDNLPLPKDEMASKTEVVLAEAVNSTPGENPVEKIMVNVGADIVAQVEGDGGVDALGKGPLKVGDMFLEIE